MLLTSSKARLPDEPNLPPTKKPRPARKGEHGPALADVQLQPQNHPIKKNPIHRVKLRALL